jgi:hypothetical protein
MKNLNVSPVWIIIGGFVLVLIGAAIPWLIVLRFIPSTFFLNFFAFGSTILGLMLGIVGAAYLVRGRKR